MTQRWPSDLFTCTRPKKPLAVHFSWFPRALRYTAPANRCIVLRSLTRARPGPTGPGPGGAYIIIYIYDYKYIYIWFLARELKPARRIATLFDLVARRALWACDGLRCATLLLTTRKLTLTPTEIDFRSLLGSRHSHSGSCFLYGSGFVSGWRVTLPPPAPCACAGWKQHGFPSGIIR